ncbi:hypothetical protein JCM11641_006364 [Rhodosporidiobolus odoratus]
MPTLSTSLSCTSDATFDKKLEEGTGRTGVAAAVDSNLPAISEDELDEGAKIAGEVAQQFTEEEMRAVRWQIDKRVIPCLALTYFSQFLDKQSVNYSSVMGLPIKGLHYNLVVMAFYIGFLIAEMPMSTLAQRFPLAKFLGCSIICWATALILHSSSANWGVFFLWRVLLGVFESIVSPILIALIASFYRKNEQAKRIGSFYVMNGCAQILGGLLAWGVTHYKGEEPAPWRIIYFILGGLAFIVGAVVLLFLPSSPATASFLTQREKQIALERVRANQSGTVSRVFKKEQMRDAFTDPKVYFLIAIMAMISVPNAAITSFTSILIKSFGYTSQEALLMNMPCGAVAIVTTLSISYLADKKNWRMIPLILSVIPSVVGTAILIAYSKNGAHGGHKGPLLVGIFLSQTFVSGIAPIYSWSAANIGGSTKKAIVNGLMLIAFGGGNLAGSQAFQATDAPRYLPGKIALFIALFLVIVGAVIMHLSTASLNKKKANEVARLVQENGWSEEDLQREKDKYAFADLTDRQNPFYQYLN